MIVYGHVTSPCPVILQQRELGSPSSTLVLLFVCVENKSLNNTFLQQPSEKCPLPTILWENNRNVLLNLIKLCTKMLVIFGMGYISPLICLIFHFNI